MEKLNTEQMTFTSARHLPIVKQYAKRINLVETINHLIASQMDLSPGMAILAWFSIPFQGERPFTG